MALSMNFCPVLVWAPLDHGWAACPAQLAPRPATADSTTFNCAHQASSNTTTSNTTSIIFEYEQRASACGIPCADGRRPLVPRSAEPTEPGMSRSSRDLNVYLLAAQPCRTRRKHLEVGLSCTACAHDLPPNLQAHV